MRGRPAAPAGPHDRRNRVGLTSPYNGSCAGSSVNRGPPCMAGAALTSMTCQTVGGALLVAASDGCFRHEGAMMTQLLENHTPPGTPPVTSRLAGGVAAWPVSLLMLIIVAQPAVSMLASSLLDSVYTIVDSSWREVTVVDGNAARNVQVIAQLATAIIACHLLIKGLRRPPNSASVLAVAATVALGFQLLRGPSPAELLGQSTFLLVIWAVSLNDASHQVMRWLGGFSVFFWITTWAFVLVDPEAGSKVCREDKCSPAGFLLMGYMQHEQTMALFSALLLPTLAFLPRVVRTPALVLGLVTIAATGSRTGFLAGAVGVLAFWALVPLRGKGEAYWIVRRLATARPLLAMLPVVATLASLGLLLLLPPRAFTGRGQIWQRVRESVADRPWFGPGRGTLEHGYAMGELDWVAWTEHNVAGHLLTVGGVVVLLLFLIGMLQLGFQSLTSGGFAAILVLLPAATAAGTEVVWSFDLLASVSAWTLVLAVLLAPMSRRGDGMRTDSVCEGMTGWLRRDRRLLLSSATVGAALAVVLNAVTPQMFEARSDVLLTASPDLPSEVATQLEYVQQRTPSYARVITAWWHGGALEGVTESGSKVSIDVEVPHGTTVVRLMIRAPSAESASSLAVALAHETASRLPMLDRNVHVLPLGSEPIARPVSPGVLVSMLGGAAIALILTLSIRLGRVVTPNRQQADVGSAPLSHN